MRGSGRFPGPSPREPTRGPVLIPFIAGQWSLRAPRRISASTSARLNPLHCGAVVASRGQWSRRTAQAGFNPLHCGAVVASSNQIEAEERARQVSIPFIAGQWSLRAFRGAVVWYVGEVSIPFIAGQWSLLIMEVIVIAAAALVSIPFIAGQWSLPPPSPQGGGGPTWSFNPLHCGAVVASTSRGASTRRPSSSFNPLHCGAVVASRRFSSASGMSLRVSIPFIAGQWSLLESLARLRADSASFNPLHCGAVVASLNRASPATANNVFQSPSLRGSGRFSLAKSQIGFPSSCFNPLHCGAVVASA